MNSKRFRYAYEIDLEADSTPNKVLDLVGENKKVLELGCGPGHMSKVLTKHLGCQVRGIEIDPEAAKAARDFCRDVTVCNLDETDLRRLFKNGQFDVIIAADILEHLKTPERTLVQCKHLLRQDGYLVISIPNASHVGIVANLMSAQFPYSDIGLLDRTHLRFFTGPSFRSLLRETGYLIDKWLTHKVPVEHTEFKRVFHSLPGPIRKYLIKSPDGLVYQFIIKAQPAPNHESDSLAVRLDKEVEQQIKERDLWLENSYFKGLSCDRLNKKEHTSLFMRLFQLLIKKK